MDMELQRDTPAPAPSWRLGQRVIARPSWLTDALLVDALYVVAVSALALIIRLWNLGDYPFGLHGDEASTGLDARAIADGTDLWPYTPSALGQPAGPMYWSVPFIKLFGSTVFAVRLPLALFGVGTVIFGFLALRELFGRPAAYIGAFLLACSSWLIFYNRTGYSVSSMPFTEMASVYFVALALNRRWWPWYLIAGVVVGAGIYGYYSYPLFAAGLGLWVIVHAVIERPRPLLQHAGHLAIMGLAALLLIQPMWHYLTSEDIGYRHDRTLFSVSNTPEYKAAGTGKKIDLYWENFKGLSESLMKKGKLDASDGSGAKPALDGLTVVLAGSGLLFSLVLAWRERRAAYLLPFLVIPLVLIGPVWSTGSYHRRALGILPFVIMPAAVLLGYIWTSIWEYRPRARVVLAGVMVLVLAWYGWVNLDKYFDEINDSDIMQATFGPELLLVTRLIDDAPDETHVYFASERWSANYETPRYLLPDWGIAKGNVEDRSKEFAPRGAPQGFDVLDRSRPSLIILMGGYMQQADAIASRYPDAERVTGQRVGRFPAYEAFRLAAR